MLNILTSNAACADAFGGQQNAENLLNKMIICNVPNSPWVFRGPAQDSWDAVAANNSGTPGWENASSTFFFDSNGNGIWNGSQYMTFVGNKFANATLGQQETMLFHEMSHPYMGASGGQDTPDSMYSPYGNGALGGGISLLCGTQSLPPPPN